MRLTASVLVVYEPGEVDLLEALGALQELSPELLDSKALTTVTGWLNGNGSTFHGSFDASHSTARAAPSGEGTHTNALLPLSLLFLGLRRLFTGGVARPQWYDLLWFSLFSDHLLNRRPHGRGS